MCRIRAIHISIFISSCNWILAQSLASLDGTNRENGKSTHNQTFTMESLQFGWNIYELVATAAEEITFRPGCAVIEGKAMALYHQLQFKTKSTLFWQGVVFWNAFLMPNLKCRNSSHRLKLFFLLLGMWAICIHYGKGNDNDNNVLMFLLLNAARKMPVHERKVVTGWRQEYASYFIIIGNNFYINRIAMLNIGHCSTLNAMQFDYFIQQDAFCVATNFKWFANILRFARLIAGKLLTTKQFPQKAK